jgi:omega-6 fatty acid desaturase (delta-12 desaturase)
MSMRFATIDAAVSPTSAAPGVKEVRGRIADNARAKSTFKGLFFFGISVAPFALGLAGFFLLHGWPLKTLAAAVMTAALPMMFIVGHDACHQSLTPHRWLNKLIGRLTMIPTWHAYSVF